MKSKQGNYISIRSTVAISIISIVSTYFIAIQLTNKSTPESSSISENTANCKYDILRLSGYRYVMPVMVIEDECESQDLDPIKEKVNKVIEEFKASGELISASVYMKDFSKNEWFGINEGEKFNSGSLLKVPELFCFLKMNEEHPGLLSKKLTYSHPFNTDKKPIFLSKSIQLGHTYTIKELLTYMITYSDNNATMLLNANIDLMAFQKVFADLGLNAPDSKSVDYPISAKDCSIFMRVLINATYLTKEDSEFAAELLAQSDFKDGFFKNLPDNLRMVHKFGEAGNGIENELNETAVIYLTNRTYLLTVMTKGKDFKKLSQILSQISDIVYQCLQ